MQLDHINQQYLLPCPSGDIAIAFLDGVASVTEVTRIQDSNVLMYYLTSNKRAFFVRKTIDGVAYYYIARWHKLIED